MCMFALPRAIFLLPLIPGAEAEITLRGTLSI